MTHKTIDGHDRSEVIVGILLLIVAGVLWYDAINLSQAVAYGVGPAMMPKVIGGGLGVLGVLSILKGIKSTADKAGGYDRQAVGTILAGFLALTVIIGVGGGFLLAMTVLFAATSYAFGRRAVVADVVLGFVLALGVYLLFSKLLALSLPQGPLERLIG